MHEKTLCSTTPVSDVLEAELRRECSGGILAWLDAAGTWTSFVDRLRARETPPAFGVHGFRGSYLALMLELQAPTSGETPPVIVVHLPSFNEESIRATPLLGLYRSGKRYRKRLDTLVREAAAQKVAPARIEAFLAAESITLEDADRWLCEEIAASDGGFAAALRDHTARSVIEDLHVGEALSKRLGEPDARRAIWARMEAWIGVPTAWREIAAPGEHVEATAIADAAAGWALAVEFVHDLERPPVSALLQPARDLDRAVVESCSAIASSLRKGRPDVYRRIATDTSAMLQDEQKHARAEDLGKIDTFQFEEQKVLDAAVEALHQADWAQAASWATHRLDASHASACFWLLNDPRRRSAWQLVAALATLGTRIDAALAPSSVSSWPELIDAYTTRGAAVDRAHRELETLANDVLVSGMPKFARLRSLQRELWRRWQTWADDWSEATVGLGERVGFLPEAEHQQRMIFRQVVEPLLSASPGSGGRALTAYILMDAMRFEMATRVVELLQAPGVSDTIPSLHARLAELPADTRIGMNALAPAENAGRLQVRWKNGEPAGMRVGQTTVRDPESRRAAMAARAGGAACPLLSFADILRDNDRSLKHTVMNAKLVVVHNMEIDKSGENALGLDTFDRVLRDLISVWRLLRDAGVTRFVITADHGFLMTDPQREPQRWGTRGTAARRCVYSENAMTSPDTVTVSASSLNYDGVDGAFVFPRSTRVFDTRQRPGSFAHGGPSLQERVIPVLTIRHKRPRGGVGGKYRATLEAGQALGEFHKLVLRVEELGALSLGFAAGQEVATVVRAVDGSDVAVRIEQVLRGGRVDEGRLLAEVGQDVELFVSVRGPRGERVQLEAVHTERAVELEPARTRTFFDVTPTRAAAPGSPLEVGEGESPAPEAAQPTKAAAERAESGKAGPAWLDSIEDEAARIVLLHIAKHGSISEQDVVRLCGTARRMRRFSRQLDEWLPLLPFSVRVEQAPSGKRWLREGATT